MMNNDVIDNGAHLEIVNNVFLPQAENVVDVPNRGNIQDGENDQAPIGNVRPELMDMIRNLVIDNDPGLPNPVAPQVEPQVQAEMNPLPMAPPQPAAPQQEVEIDVRGDRRNRRVRAAQAARARAGEVPARGRGAGRGQQPQRGGRDGAAPNAGRGGNNPRGADRGRGGRGRGRGAPRNHGGLVQQGLVQALQEAQGAVDAVRAQAAVPAVNAIEPAVEPELELDELELLEDAEDGEILHAGDAKRVTALVRENIEMHGQVRELRNLKDSLMTEQLGLKSQVSNDYTERNARETIPGETYGPYVINSTHTLLKGGVHPIFHIIVLFSVQFLTVGGYFFYPVIAALCAISLYLVWILFTIYTLVYPSRSYKFLKRQFTITPTNDALDISDRRIEASRATKATLSPKLGTMVFDSWVSIDPKKLRLFITFKRGIVFKWKQLVSPTDEEFSTAKVLKIGFFTYSFINHGACIKKNRSAVISIEKYLQLISTQNIDTNREFGTIIDIIHRKAKSMPTINLDKRFPLTHDIDQSTILAAELYAEFFISSDIGRNLHFMKKAHPLSVPPSQ